MSRADLGRCYDYCSELLSLVSKAAALCAEESADSVVLDTVSEIEVLTNGMSRKDLAEDQPAAPGTARVT